MKNINEEIHSLRAPFFERDEAVQRPTMTQLSRAVGFLDEKGQDGLLRLFRSVGHVNGLRSYVYFEGIRKTCDLKSFHPTRTINDKNWNGKI